LFKTNLLLEIIFYVKNKLHAFLLIRKKIRTLQILLLYLYTDILISYF